MNFRIAAHSCGSLMSYVWRITLPKLVTFTVRIDVYLSMSILATELHCFMLLRHKVAIGREFYILDVTISEN